MIILITYIIGFLITFYVCRKDFRTFFQDDYTWPVAIYVIATALLSWYGLILYLINKWSDRGGVKGKPPTWL